MKTSYISKNAILEPETQNRHEMASFFPIAKSLPERPILQKSRMRGLLWSFWQKLSVTKQTRSLGH